MNSCNLIFIRVNPDGSAVRVLPDGTTEPYQSPEPDWAKLDAMTDEEITAAALSDPDNPPLTDEELDRMAFAARVQRLRRRLGLSQVAFAERFHLPAASVRDWEEGRCLPDEAMQAYFTVIEREPEAVERALAG